jgi:hypothetical protein
MKPSKLQSLQPGWVITYKDGTSKVFTQLAFDNRFVETMKDENIESFVKWTYIAAAALNHPEAVIVMG